MTNHRRPTRGQPVVFDHGDSAVIAAESTATPAIRQVSSNNEEGMHMSMHASNPGNSRTLPTRIAILAAILFVGHMRSGRTQVATEMPPAVPGATQVIVQHVRIHSAAIAGNLAGEPADRDVIVFLPSGYYKDKERRYPVVYALHGFFIEAAQWTHEIAFRRPSRAPSPRAAGP